MGLVKQIRTTFRGVHRIIAKTRKLFKVSPHLNRIRYIFKGPKPRADTSNEDEDDDLAAYDAMDELNSDNKGDDGEVSLLI